MDGGWGAASGTPRRSRLRNVHTKHRSPATEDGAAPQVEDLVVENEGLKDVITSLETKLVAYEQRYIKASRKAESEIIELNGSMERMQSYLANIVQRQRALLRSSTKQIIESTPDHDLQESENHKTMEQSLEEKISKHENKVLEMSQKADEAESKMNELNAVILSLQQRLTSEETNNQNLHQENAKLLVELKGKELQIKERDFLIRRLESTKAYADDERNANAKLSAENETLKAKSGEYENKFKEASQKAAEAELKMNELRDAILSFQQRLLSVQATNQTLQQDNEMLIEDLKRKELQIKEFEDLLIREREDAKTYVYNATIWKDKLSAENERLKELEKSLETKLRKSELRYDETSQKAMEAESQISEFKIAVQRLQDNLDTAESQIRALEKDNAALQAELTSIRSKIEEKTKVIEQDLSEKDANMNKYIVANENFKVLVESLEKQIMETQKKYDEGRKTLSEYESKMNEQNYERQRMQDKMAILEIENQVLTQKIYLCSYLFAVQEESEISELRNSTERLQGNLAAMEDKQSDLLQENRKLKETAEKAQIATDGHTAELNIIIESLQTKLNDAKNESEDARRTKVEVEQNLNEQILAMRSLEEKFVVLLENIQVLHQKIFVLSFVYAVEAQSEINDMNDTAEQLKVNLASAEVNIKALLLENEKLKDDLQEAKGSLEQALQLKDRYRAENESLKASVRSHELRISESEAKALEADLSIKSLQSKLQSHKQELATLKAESVVLKQQQPFTQAPSERALEFFPQITRLSDSDSESQNSEDQKELSGATLLLKQENVDVLIDCTSEKVGFSQGRPVAAIMIYKCLLQWKKFEAEKTSIFDRIIHVIGSSVEEHDNFVDLSYWLSNCFFLLSILQRTLKAAQPSGLPRRSLLGMVTQGFRNSFARIAVDLDALNPIEAKQPAMLFKLQIENAVKTIYGKILNKAKMALISALDLVIQKGIDDRESASEDASQGSQWQTVIDQLDELLKALQENYVLVTLSRNMICQLFSYINVRLFNSFLLRRECCSFSNGEHVKHGLERLEFWCSQAKEYAVSAPEELKHSRQVVSFLLIFQKINITSEMLITELCPELSLPQIYKICTQYFDEKYSIQTVSPEVLQEMRELMGKDAGLEDEALVLVPDERIPFNAEELSNSLRDVDTSHVPPPKALAENPAFQFLQ